MDRHRIAQRINLVGVTTGSIVSTATWCALNASAADNIVSFLCERMRSVNTNEVTRSSLLYVCHELVLTCVANGTSESGRRAVMLALSKYLPLAVRDVFAQIRRRQEEERHELLSPRLNATSSFARALSKVIAWWTRLDVFPANVLNDMRMMIRRAHEEQQQLFRSMTALPSTSSFPLSCALPAVLQSWEMLLARYRDAKALWKYGRDGKRGREDDKGDTCFSGNNVDSSVSGEGGNQARKRVKSEGDNEVDDGEHTLRDMRRRDAALHALSLLQDSLRTHTIGTEHNNSSTVLVDWCEAEKSDLLGCVRATSSLASSAMNKDRLSSWANAVPPELAANAGQPKVTVTSVNCPLADGVVEKEVKEEVPDAPIEEDDVLASFY